MSHTFFEANVEQVATNLLSELRGIAFEALRFTSWTKLNPCVFDAVSGMLPCVVSARLLELNTAAFLHQHGWRITGFRNGSFDVNTKKHECRAGLECKWLGRNVGTDEVKRVTRSSKIDVDIAMFVSKTRLSRRAYAFFKRWGESYRIQTDVVYLRELCPARA
jgi:hypothetical protein